MKLNCGLTHYEKTQLVPEWKDFFAIWPRRVATRDCRWLETIQVRKSWVKGAFRGYWKFEYRAKIRT